MRWGEGGFCLDEKGRTLIAPGRILRREERRERGFIKIDRYREI